MNGYNNVNFDINNIDLQNSQSGYDSTIAPFFRGYVDIDRDKVESDSIIPEYNIINIDLINRFTHICPDQIIQDFLINNKGIDREIYTGEWTLLSMQKILDLDTTYRESEIKSIVDLGYVYHGLGWIIVAFYYRNSGKIYFRMDGGSNCYDRLSNFNNLKTINHSIKMVIENGITFTDLLYRIQHNKELPQTVI